MNCLMINIDDYGASIPADKRILDLLKSGAASSVSFFATSPHFAQASANLLALSQEFDIGVHLDLSFGKGVLHGVQTFGEKGQYPKLLSTLRPGDVKDEFRAQTEKLLAAGIELTHMDNHRPEIYFMPQLFKTVLELASEFGLYVRTPFTSSFERRISQYSHHYAVSKDELRHVWKKSYDMQEKIGSLHADHFELFTGVHHSVEGMRGLLSNLEEGLTELCSHAGQTRQDFAGEYDVLSEALSLGLTEGKLSRRPRQGV